MKTGFTLIEILIVVVLLGILAAIIIPQFLGTEDAVSEGKAQSDIATLNRTAQYWCAKNGGFPAGDFDAAAATLSTDGFIKEVPSAPPDWTYSYDSTTGLFACSEN